MTRHRSTKIERPSPGVGDVYLESWDPPLDGGTEITRHRLSASEAAVLGRELISAAFVAALPEPISGEVDITLKITVEPQ